MTEEPTPEQIEAGRQAVLANFHPPTDLKPTWHLNPEEVARAVLAAAAGAAPQPEGLMERIVDTLAYYQCRETNPKADHPRMGYHSFPEEQHAHLRGQKAEAAAEIVRMMAASAAPQEPMSAPSKYINPSLPGMIRNLWKSDPSEASVRTALGLAGDLIQELIDLRAAPVQVDESKLAKVIRASAGEWGDASHVPDVLSQYISRAVVEWLRGGGR